MRCDLIDRRLYIPEIPFGLIVGRIGIYLYDRVAPRQRSRCLRYNRRSQDSSAEISRQKRTLPAINASTIYTHRNGQFMFLYLQSLIDRSDSNENGELDNAITM